MLETEVVYGVNGDWQNHPAAFPAALRAGWYRTQGEASLAAMTAAENLVRACQGRGRWAWGAEMIAVVTLDCGYVAHFTVYPFTRELRDDNVYAEA